jgi:hypothetical protein
VSLPVLSRVDADLPLAALPILETHLAASSVPCSYMLRTRIEKVISSVEWARPPCRVVCNACEVGFRRPETKACLECDRSVSCVAPAVRDTSSVEAPVSSLSSRAIVANKVSIFFPPNNRLPRLENPSLSEEKSTSFSSCLSLDGICVSMPLKLLMRSAILGLDSFGTWRGTLCDRLFPNGERLRDERLLEGAAMGGNAVVSSTALPDISERWLPA